MHEISLVQAMLQQLSDLAAANRATKVIKITMKIGQQSGVVADSFRFGFEVLSANDDLVRGAELAIISSPATFRCTQCDHTVTAMDRPDCCPKCQETFLIPEGGDELILQQVEME
ncbi:MAG: hydrogenase maturation nickel metallochaperone HypA [Desulfocapsaceae bacterium]|nr:hydrogenase maturation nickel metallochaperone HypA [Desulfocapsaceae bacterium]